MKRSGARAKIYYKREKLTELGGAATEYLTELVHRRPMERTTSVEALFDLLQDHGDDAMRGAFERGLRERVFGAEYIGHFLAPESTPAPARWSFHGEDRVSGKGAGGPPRGRRGAQPARRTGRAAPRRGDS